MFKDKCDVSNVDTRLSENFIIITIDKRKINTFRGDSKNIVASTDGFLKIPNTKIKFNLIALKSI